MANDYWQQETQAVSFMSETSALISQLAEHIELTAEMETGVSPEVLHLSSVPLQSWFAVLITRSLYVTAYNTKNTNTLKTAVLKKEH